MTPILIGWICSAAVIGFIAGLVGWAATKLKSGILIDTRGRYSLTHLQLVAWTIVGLSLVTGVAFGRLVGGGAAIALDFPIPKELLGAMGISVVSTAAASTLKAAKNLARPAQVSASNDDDTPHFLQVFLTEEGQFADKTVDVTKFQNFWITLVVIGAYIALAGTELAKTGSPVDFKIPAFSPSMLALLGISHAGYVAGKLSNPKGEAPGLTVALRRAGAKPRADGEPHVPTYVPRHHA